MRSIDPSTLRIIDLWGFKSTKSNKRYIVEVEKTLIYAIWSHIKPNACVIGYNLYFS